MPTSETKPASTRSPLAEMRMSPEALSNMRSTERAILRYYNDMGKTTGNCTWGIGFYAHKGVCTPEELQRKVAAPSIDIEYAKRVAEAERRVKLKVKVPLNQDQFDGLVSFTYNTKNQINQHVYDKINGSDFPGAARLMSQVTRVTVDGKPKLAPGLIKRRSEESAPFWTIATGCIQSSPKVAP